MPLLALRIPPRWRPFYEVGSAFLVWVVTSFGLFAWTTTTASIHSRGPRT